MNIPFATQRLDSITNAQNTQHEVTEWIFHKYVSDENRNECKGYPLLY